MTEPIPTPAVPPTAGAELLPLGTRTVWGVVQAIGCIDGERYYWLECEVGTISMMPASVVENQRAPASHGGGEGRKDGGG